MGAGAPEGKSILARVYKAQESNDESNYMISVPSKSSTATSKLPNATAVTLLVDDDTDFSTGFIEYPMTLNGTQRVVSGVDIDDAQYVTFAATINTAPGGVW